MSSILLVANPASAMGRSRQVLKQTIKWFARHGIATHQIVSQYAGHLLEALPPLLKESWQSVVVLGGDGTLFEVINLCLDPSNSDEATPFATPIALIPSGTGNSFSKDLTGATLEDFLHKAIHGTPQLVDVARCRLADSPANSLKAAGRSWPKNEYYFINVLGTGFVAEVNYRSLPYKKFGMLGYAVGVFATLTDLQHYRLHLAIDGQTFERSNSFIAICNSRYIGGNMKIAPEAKISDGLLDIVLANDISRWELMQAFPSVFSGRHLTNPHIEIFRGRRLRVETDPPCLLTPDGETLGTTPVEVEILPGKLCFMT